MLGDMGKALVAPGGSLSRRKTCISESSEPNDHKTKKEGRLYDSKKSKFTVFASRALYDYFFEGSRIADRAVLIIRTTFRLQGVHGDDRLALRRSSSSSFNA